MSHQAEYTTRIRVVVEAPKTDIREEASSIEQNPSMEILRRALEITASENGGTLTDSIKDNEGRSIACDLGIKTAEFERGLGIKIDRGGQISFIYDAYGGYEKIVGELKGQITQNYTVVAIIRALKELDYRIDTDESDKENITVEGLKT